MTENKESFCGWISSIYVNLFQIGLKVHPHSKPIELQTALIKATTNENDVVLDPASGGYSVFQACKNCSRNFIGCDIELGEI